MASDTLTIKPGNDTNITGSQVGGNTVNADIGGNLHIITLQGTETYWGDNESLGGGISRSLSSGSKKEWLPDSLRKYDSTPYVPGTTSSSAFWGKGRMDSDYASVTKQARIYAGEGGFTIQVGDNTHLTGALLDSTATADKNSLATGTLTMEDIGNKAAYDVKDIGVSYHHYGSESDRNRHFNQSGLTPSISPGAQNEASSVTQSVIAPGTIITMKAQTDLSQINRNTAAALHKLDQIFDKKDIKERQELAQLFSKNANELLHYYDRDGKFDKALAHGLVAEISSQIAGNRVGSGLTAGFTNERLINKIKGWSGGDPAKAQWISAALGATVNSAIGKDPQTGSATAQYGTKWNLFGDGHPGQKIIDVAIGIEHGIMGHTSLVMKFADGTYEQANFGRYGGDGERISFGRYPAPNGSGTYTFDYHYYPGKDGQILYWLNLNANDIAYYYNQTILNTGYYSYNPPNGIIIGEDINGNAIYSGDSYRNGGESDYRLLYNNCTTTTILTLYGPSGKDNWLLNDLSDEISPYIVNWKLKQWGFASGLVSEIYDPEEH